MPSRNFVWTNPAWEAWMREHGPALEWNARKLHEAFLEAFGPGTPGDRLVPFRGFLNWVRDGGHIIPPSHKRVFTEEVLQVSAKGALITADHQVPFHDADWMAFAVEMGAGFGCDTHIFNGDIFDMACFSRFDRQTREGSALEEEMEVVERMIEISTKRFKESVFLYGNHEWRVVRRLLQSQLSKERFLRMTTIEAITTTDLSYIVVNDRVRVTHPSAYSRIAARVGTVLATKFHQDVVVAHDHQVGYARDISGDFTVVHSGCMADPRRLDYAITSDTMAPAMSQGFVILTPGGQLILFDRKNCDREWWRWAIAHHLPL